MQSNKSVLNRWQHLNLQMATWAEYTLATLVLHYIAIAIVNNAYSCYLLAIKGVMNQEYQEHWIITLSRKGSFISFLLFGKWYFKQFVVKFTDRISDYSIKMMPGRIGHLPIASENPLGLSWHDSAWIPSLNPSNIMDYFSERSNPFFDRTCNNEVVKMQRLSMDQLQNMTGLEYVLLHVQEPILYVIRKQHRHSINQTIPLADYYIIAGIVYQAPDLASVLNSRLLSAVHHLQNSFEETMSYSKYHPSKGYWWDFKTNKSGSFNLGQSAPKEVSSAPKEEPSTLFQRQRVDMLLAELVRQFPLPVTQTTANQNGVTVKSENTNDKISEKGSDGTNINITIKQEPVDPISSEMTNGNIQGQMEIKTEIKQENMKPPPEKKPRT